MTKPTNPTAIITVTGSKIWSKKDDFFFTKLICFILRIIRLIVQFYDEELNIGFFYKTKLKVSNLEFVTSLLTILLNNKVQARSADV